MNEKLFFTDDELMLTSTLLANLKQLVGPSLRADDEQKIRRHLAQAMESNQIKRDVFGLNPVVCALQTALLAAEETGLQRDGVMAILLYDSVLNGFLSQDDVARDFGTDVATIIGGLVRIQELYKKSPVIESENFRNLLLSFAEDMRVILIMIADRVNLMRQIRDTDNKSAQQLVAQEASYLYAPLAHKLGLYKLKSELEDLSLKYLEHDAYYMIKDKLNATKKSRDAYIKRFIAPIEEKLKAEGLHFHMKGRTKSIHSIWQKMKKQKCDFEGIYDLFAIRIIIETPPDVDQMTEQELRKLKAEEKTQCWKVFSIITNMYTSNPKRLRDWLTVPKSNGYESLHTTVLGPENKWVEVQIRTERMDDVAEHGLAAHWRYKGIKAGNSGIDAWLADIRSILESGDSLMTMDQFRSDLYDKEVYVFTPKGDLLKFSAGATVLDYAYHIHSKLGNTCVGAKVNGKNVSFRYELKSGDTVEILTSHNQKPSREWLNIVKSPRAKAKIRLALKETQVREGAYAKEMLERRFKNKKLEIEESVMMHLIKKLGFKEVSDFYKQVADGKLDVNNVVEQYIQVRDYDQNLLQQRQAQSAEEFEFENPDAKIVHGNDDVLIIDQNLKGIDFTLAKCCHPIYGDPVFGFVTVNGGIKIHRKDCPNAAELHKRFGYRIVKAQWSGKGQSTYSITLRVVGNDDIGIVSNITNIISRDEKLVMRSINIDSNDGLFRGNIEVMLDDTSKLEKLIKKLRTVKGVKQVTRL